MKYIGADLHKEQTWFFILDQTGAKLLSKSIANKPEVLHHFFQSITGPFIVAVEATYNWYFFIDIAEQYAEKVFLANSYELKAFAKRHKKTDKIDARLIADVLRKGYLPSVFIPSKEIREMKEPLHYRINLVMDRSRNILRLKNVLDKLGIDSEGDYTTEKGLRTIPVDNFAPRYQFVIAGYIERISELTKRIAAMKRYMRDEFGSDTDIKNLITIPGIDYFSALLIKTEIADIQRFGCFNRLCAYAGLAPNVAQSGNKAAVHGGLMKNRRKMLRWILLETVFHFIRSCPERVQRYEQLKVRKGANTAKVIMARQFLNVIYNVLKKQRPYYRQEQPRPEQTGFQIQSVATAALSGV